MIEERYSGQSKHTSNTHAKSKKPSFVGVKRNSGQWNWNVKKLAIPSSRLWKLLLWTCRSERNVGIQKILQSESKKVLQDIAGEVLMIFLAGCQEMTYFTSCILNQSENNMYEPSKKPRMASPIFNKMNKTPNFHLQKTVASFIYRSTQKCGHFRSNINVWIIKW